MMMQSTMLRGVTPVRAGQPRHAVNNVRPRSTHPAHPISWVPSVHLNTHIASRAARRMVARATLNVTDDATGITFPLVQEFWQGETYRSMGAGARTKKIALFNVKVYAITLYVEADKAARELGIRKRGGFFDDDNDDDYALALADGGFDKCVQLELARSITGQQFVEALNDALEPRLKLMGAMGELEQFKAFFMSKQLEKGTNVAMLVRTGETLDVVVSPSKEASYAMATPELSIVSAGLCRALLEVFLGSSSVVPDAKREWTRGARSLLSSDEIRRDSRKSGS